MVDEEDDVRAYLCENQVDVPLGDVVVDEE